MKRLATPLLFLLGIVCLVTLGNWRSACHGLQATTPDLITTSNRLGILAAELEQARLTSRQTSEALRQRESEVALARAEFGKLKPAGEELRVEARAWQAQLAVAETKIKVAPQRAETLPTTINELHAEKTVFHQQWNDPASVRAQLSCLVIIGFTNELLFAASVSIHWGGTVLPIRLGHAVGGEVPEDVVLDLGRPIGEMVGRRVVNVRADVELGENAVEHLGRRIHTGDEGPPARPRTGF